MNKTLIRSLYKKEMMDILRDKKTILMMIVIPLILYPMLFMGSMYLASNILNESTSRVYTVGIDSFEGSEAIREFIKNNQKSRDYKFLFTNRDDLRLALDDNDIASYISASLSDNGLMEYTVNFNGSNNSSNTAANMLSDMLTDYKVYLRKNLIEDAGLDAEYINSPISISINNIASTEKTMGNVFGYILPFLLISSVLMGAMYPAIDITSGEKERGTLETLLTLPVSNFDLIASKFLATASVATGAAFLNVLSMGLLGLYFYTVMGETSSEYAGFNVALYIPSILLTMLVAIIFAMLCSAVCLSVCIFAKGFKEAQNYTTPIMMVFLFAGMVTAFPSISLNGKTSLIPVVNFALLVAEVFKFNYDFRLILNVIAINGAFCILAIVFMTKVFSSENILFGDNANGIRIIEKRSEMQAGNIPGVGDILLLFSILLIVLMLPGSLLALKFGIYGTAYQQIIIAALPILYCWYIKVDFKKLFNLNKPKIKHLFASVLTWFGAFLIILVLTAVMSSFFNESASSISEQQQELLGKAGFILTAFVVALMPALCEEIAFRGFLFGTLSNRYKIWTAIIWTGLVFGAYHMSIIKLLLVGALGAVMAYVVYKTKSIFCSMLMHFLNNFTAVIVSFYPEKIEEMFPVLVSDETVLANGIIVTMLGLIIFIVGILLLRDKKSKRLI